MILKKLPIYISSFKDMIEGNCLYIDKTKYIYDLFIRKNLNNELNIIAAKKYICSYSIYFNC
ncbi:AAA family ATPase [Candidatus Babela massiliensis]|uniref:AAA family ATPase n=1 Tax=Candidatus Babela massiliensis TaxID=673862 RepID=UPI0011B936D2